MAAMVQTGARRIMTTSLGVGLAAGTLGTWMEMSHGVVCIPVVTLPPLALSQQIAVGSTVFGVAARQVLSASLYSLEPDANLATLEEAVDVRAAAVLGASGTFAAVAFSLLSARLGQKPLRQANGLFCIVTSLFLQWRETYWVPEDKRQKEQETDGCLPEPEPLVLERDEVQVVDPDSNQELMRHLALGFGSGAVLGLFGIGPAWMLAPLLHRSAPTYREVQGVVPGGDEKLRRTCCLAMVPASLGAAWYHSKLGHVVGAKEVALPLATGAIAGSALGGLNLADVPCESEVKSVFAVLLFAFGCWSVVKL